MNPSCRRQTQGVFEASLRREGSQAFEVSAFLALVLQALGLDWSVLDPGI